MITIEKRKVKLEMYEFLEELSELCNLVKKYNPVAVGIELKTINEHFNVKLKTYDFYILSETLEFPVRRKNFWYFDDMDIFE